VAQAEGVPFRFPRPDPIVQNMETLEIAAEQPRIRRVTRLAAAAQMRGQSLAFTWAVAQVMWNGSVSQWHEGDHLSRAITQAGLNAEALEAEVRDNEAGCEARIAQNEAAHAASGHWGVPTFVYEGEPFFGQDRIDLLLWRLKQKGLKPR
jgi:2-hydroxychromene-2-carboxylate isomerase